MDLEKLKEKIIRSGDFTGLEKRNLCKILYQEQGEGKVSILAEMYENGDVSAHVVGNGSIDDLLKCYMSLTCSIFKQIKANVDVEYGQYDADISERIILHSVVGLHMALDEEEEQNK